MKHHWKAAKIVASMLFLAWGAVSLCNADIVNLGAANSYAVLGLSGATVTNSLVTVNGNEGIGSAGSIDNMNLSQVNGNVVENNSGQYTGGGTLNGSLITNAQTIQNSLSAAQTTYNEAISLKPTQGWGGISRAVTIQGDGGLNVIDINGNINLNNYQLTLSGTSNDEFIIVVDGGLAATGKNAGIALVGGVKASNVLWVFDGKGHVSSQAGDTLDGTFLAPNYNVTLQGNLNGAVIGGGNTSKITLMSGAVVNYVPFAAVGHAPPPGGVPEPGTYIMIAVGLSLFGIVRLVRRLT